MSKIGYCRIVEWLACLEDELSRRGQLIPRRNTAVALLPSSQPEILLRPNAALDPRESDCGGFGPPAEVWIAL